MRKNSEKSLFDWGVAAKVTVESLRHFLKLVFGALVDNLGNIAR